jgi:hypothetical protein
MGDVSKTTINKLYVYGCNKNMLVEATAVYVFLVLVIVIDDNCAAVVTENALRIASYVAASRQLFVVHCDISFVDS